MLLQPNLLATQPQHQQKNIRNVILEAIVKELKERKEERQESQGGGANVQKKRSISYGLTKQLLEKHKQANPWLSKDVLENYKQSKAKKETATLLELGKPPMPPTPVETVASGHEPTVHVIEQKAKLRYDCKIEQHDIVGVVHHSWNQSFAKVEGNKKAIAERGWAPLTYNLLDHPELQRTKNMLMRCVSFQDGRARTLQNSTLTAALQEP